MTFQQKTMEDKGMRLTPFSLFIVVLLAACSSKPPQSSGPAWTRQPVRTVDNGYIVYVDADEAVRSEKAQFKAEGLALQDLANECSFVPKGARIEDRYSEQVEHGNKAYVKLAVEFQECDQAQKTTDPSEIKKLANISFTQQLKGYQDLLETGSIPQNIADQESDPSLEIPPPPMQLEHEPDNIHFYALRQYVSYQTEIVILSPPTTYAPHSPEYAKFNGTLTSVNQQIQQMQIQNPALKTTPTPWSQIADKPVIKKPIALAPRADKNMPHPMTAKKQQAHANLAQKPNKYRHRRNKKDE